MKRYVSSCLMGFSWAVLSMGFQGCETIDHTASQTDAFSPSVWVSRYEIRIDEGDTSGQTQVQRGEAAKRREAALRAVVVQFGGALVDQRPQVDYTHDADGNIVPHTVWKISVDVEGDSSGEQARELRKRIGEAFGRDADLWITRYPVQKILQ